MIGQNRNLEAVVQQPGADGAILERVGELKGVNESLRRNPLTVVANIDRGFLDVILTTPNAGLLFDDSSSAESPNPPVVGIPAAVRVAADSHSINHFSGSPSGVTCPTLWTPLPKRIIVHPDSFEGIAASRNEKYTPDESVMVIGDPAFSGFFKRLALEEKSHFKDDLEFAARSVGLLAIAAAKKLGADIQAGHRDDLVVVGAGVLAHVITKRLVDPGFKTTAQSSSIEYRLGAFTFNDLLDRSMTGAGVQKLIDHLANKERDKIKKYADKNGTDVNGLISRELDRQFESSSLELANKN